MEQGMTIQDFSKKILDLDEKKLDLVAPINKLEMETATVDGKTIPLLQIPDHGEFTFSEHAHRQVAERLKIPKVYYDRMLHEEPDLLADNVNTWFQRRDGNRMIRAYNASADQVGGKGIVRAFLSDRYKPMDDVVVARAALPVLMNQGNEMQIKAAHITDSRLYIQAVYPKMHAEITQGDIVEAGILIRNSEVGVGQFAVEEMLWRLICLNGMITATALRKYHVGRRIDTGGEISQDYWRSETVEADQAAFAMKVTDTVSHAFDKDFFSAEVEKLQAATNDRFMPKQMNAAVENITKKMALTDTEGADVLNHLAEGGDFSRYGMAQAVTALAHNTGNADKAYGYEVAGGKVINMPDREWEGMLKEKKRRSRKTA